MDRRVLEFSENTTFTLYMVA